MYALDSAHSLSFDDRRFYFDPINNNFLPIYYDGKSNILSKDQSHNKDSLSNHMSRENKAGAKNAILLIEKIDHAQLLDRLNKNGLVISKKNYKTLIEKIIDRLKIIEQSETTEINYLETDLYFPNLDKKITKERKLIFIENNKDLLKICTFDLKNCDELILSKNLKILPEILSQRFNNVKDKEHLFVSNSFNYQDINIEENKELLKTKYNKKFKLRTNDFINYEIDEKLKLLKLNQLNNKGRALIIGGTLKEWKVVFNGSNKNNNLNVAADHMGLTGCLTLIDVKIKDSSFKLSNANCEDSLNLIRSSGIVKNIKIINSESDGLDVDFSKLILENVNVDTAKNDCIDFSFGEYNIINMTALNCEDKAISVGEKSKLNITNVKIDQSNIGIAVKDSSVVSINKSYQNNTKTCFAAYRKKQEFVGGIIKIDESNCDKEKFVEQQGSKIYLN